MDGFSFRKITTDVEAYEVSDMLDKSPGVGIGINGRHIGIVSENPTTGKWAATWNYIPSDPNKYLHESREAAAEVLREQIKASDEQHKRRVSEIQTHMSVF